MSIEALQRELRNFKQLRRLTSAMETLPMTTLTAMDIPASVVALPTHESPRKAIRDALTVMCLRLHLSANETESVIDSALTARSMHGASPARAIAEGRKTAEQIAQRRRMASARADGPEAA